MSSSDRVLQLLALFSASEPVLTPARAMAALGASRASVYRYLGQLEASGFVERVPERGYVLGPAIVELDRQIRLSDPLLDAARGLTEALSRDTGGTTLLCRFHGDKVLCIEQTAGSNAPARVSYERGRAMPMYRGATSKIILAFLKRDALAALWQRQKREMARAGLPGSFEALCEALAPLREERICVTANEVDQDAQGFAAPILDGAQVLGSVSVVLPASSIKPAQRARVIGKVLETAARIEARIETARQAARRGKGSRSGKRAKRPEVAI
jgi:DNA-binding IclR family transcriptional regulator